MWLVARRLLCQGGFGKGKDPALHSTQTRGEATAAAAAFHLAAAHQALLQAADAVSNFYILVLAQIRSLEKNG